MQFHALRELSLPSQRSFIQSLAWSHAWNASGGKSGARFEKTEDGCFVIKVLRKSEFDVFNEIAPAYFHYMSTCLTQGVPTLLVRIVGAFNKLGKVDAPRAALMRRELQRMKDTGKLSANVGEIVDRALATA